MSTSFFDRTTTCLATICIALLGGCSKDEHNRDPHDERTSHSTGHHHAPPRGGIMVELGEHEYQVEFKLEFDVKQFTMWIMDGHAESPVRIDAPSVKMVVHHESPKEPSDVEYELAAVANENTGETVGDTSQFSIPMDRLGSLGSFKATLPSLTIRGRTFKDIQLDYDARKVTK